MTLREQFEKQSGKATIIYYAHCYADTADYVKWLEAKLSTQTAPPDPSAQLMSEITTADLESAVNDGMFRQKSEPLKSRDECLIEVFQPTSFDCKTEREDLQIAITLNPSVDMIEQAMQLYADQFKKGETR